MSKSHKRFLYRNEAILELARNKTVFHLGCVGATDLDTQERVVAAGQSLHASLTEVADVTGIDISEDVIREFQKAGIFQNTIVGDIEHLDRLSMSKKFDVIVAGNIIEHISNPGLMLDGLKRFCHSDTLIIVTTPNAFGLMNFLRNLMGCFREGGQHVFVFNEQGLAQLLERHGYRISLSTTCYERWSISSYGCLFGFGLWVFRMFPKLGGTLFVTAKLA